MVGEADTTMARRRMQGPAIFALIAVCAAAVWFVSRPKVVERNPLVEARLRVASIALIGALESGRNPQDAIDAYARVLELEPDCPAGAKGLGISYVAAKNFHEGLKHLLAYLKKEPNDAEANLWAARGYRGEGTADLAIHFYERTCDLDTKHVEARRELAKLYLEKRRPLDAASKLHEALAIRDDDETRRLLDSALQLQSSMARETAIGGVKPEHLAPEVPNPLADIEKSRRPPR